MLKEDLRHILAEKVELKGRMPQFVAGVSMDWVGDCECSTAEVIWWKVLLHAQLGAGGVPSAGVSETAFRSQCFLENTGTSANAQYRWSLILALRKCQVRAELDGGDHSPVQLDSCNASQRLSYFQLGFIQGCWRK